MNREQFLRRVRRYARRNGLEYRFEPRRGKGSHGKLTVGEYSAIVPDKEIRPGLFAAILSDLNIPRRDF